MKRVAKSIVLAALVLVTAGPSYAEPLRSTSIPSSLADDEKKLMPAVMTEFYGSFDREKACWMSKHKAGRYQATYCMKPVRLDVIKSNGRKMLFIVAGGHQLNEEGGLAKWSWNERRVGAHRTDAGRRKLRRSCHERSL